jgi:DNA topoisomerase IB
VLQSVAKLLRNTPAVCRKSYVNPGVFDAWQRGALRRQFQHLTHLSGPRGERALVRFLRAN